MRLVEWNEALLSDLRSRARPERRLYLYVDRETLADVSGQGQQQALDDFCEAFRAARGSRPFAQGASSATRWAARGFADDPPFVAHLAMTVLAVTEEPLGSPHGVYRRQNALLGLPPDAAAPAGYGEDVPAMWEIWNRWLESPGSDLGRPSARTHRVWTLQGWSRSQGLVRHRDRLTIEQFVQECGPGVQRLGVGDLVVWLRYRGTASADFLARVERDEAALEVVQDVLDDELARWRRDGLRDRGQRTARGLLRYDDWDDAFSGVVHADAGLVGQVVDVGDGATLTVDDHTPLLHVAVGGAPATWLLAGAQHALTATRSAAFGGGTVFVFHDDPEVDGRLQSQRPQHFVPHHVLVHDSRRGDVEVALRAAGSAAKHRPALDGWSWYEHVVLTEDVPLLRALGLGSAVPPVPATVSLTGGMRLGRAQQYLSGQEPDVALPYIRARVVVDGTVVEATSSAPPSVRLAHLGLPPGEHVVEHGEETLRFRSLAFVRNQAENEDALRPGQRDEPGRWTFGDARQGVAEGPGLAGACVTGVPVREPVVLHRPGSDYLVLNKDGSVHQVQPLRPRWLSRHALQAQGLDVDGLASRVSGAAVVLARHPRTGAVVAARCADVPPAEGAVQQVARRDLVGELVSGRAKWKWVGEADDNLARTLLTRSLQWKAAKAKPGQAVTVRVAATRNGVVDGTHSNPFDEVLTWLSERESASASREDFMRAWTWVCDKLGRHDVAGDWRQVLQTLSDLGHVEQDYARGRVLAAPAAAVALPEANGLYVLAGARPARLLERLDDPDDADPVVADGVGLTSVEVRTPVDRAGRAIGPAAAYIEMEPRHVDLVRGAYERLGVRHHGCTARWLLDTMPTLNRAVSTGQQFSHLPGSDPHVYANMRGTWRWVRTVDTDRQGFYSFRQRHRKVFAWRKQSGADLVEVEPAVGRWLVRRSSEHLPLLHEHFADRLLVTQDLPLPSILRRALTLRTGLPAYPVRCQRSGGLSVPPMRAYENVNAAVAARVAEILGADLRSEYNDLKDLDE
ncbi:hypothetical protein ACFUMH_04290 [Cellulomonas sp. NPDC057328]|uniref:hypothetical protein n=1 Tax=Cellulomonas sp. NPDC057328 TaxID=3346101 RepID=UPI003630D833